MIENIPNPAIPAPKETQPLVGGNIRPSDFDTAKADSTRDRAGRSLVRDLPVGTMRPASK